jgi:DNA-binding MarR family transcriptional regulator
LEGNRRFYKKVDEVCAYPLGSFADDTPTFESGSVDAPEAERSVIASSEIGQEVALVRIVEAIRELRRTRREVFGLGLAEPAWDMLVELYYRDSTGASTTSAQLKDAANVPPSTAGRWVQHLEHEGWIRIQSHPSDAQTYFVELTNKAKEAMERYLAEVRSLALKQAPS